MLRTIKRSHGIWWALRRLNGGISAQSAGRPWRRRPFCIFSSTRADTFAMHTARSPPLSRSVPTPRCGPKGVFGRKPGPPIFPGDWRRPARWAGNRLTCPVHTEAALGPSNLSGENRCAKIGSAFDENEAAAWAGPRGRTAGMGGRLDIKRPGWSRRAAVWKYSEHRLRRNPPGLVPCHSSAQSLDCGLKHASGTHVSRWNASCSASHVPIALKLAERGDGPVRERKLSGERACRALHPSWLPPSAGEGKQHRPVLCACSGWSPNGHARATDQGSYTPRNRLRSSRCHGQNSHRHAQTPGSGNKLAILNRSLAHHLENGHAKSTPTDFNGLSSDFAQWPAAAKSTAKAVRRKTWTRNVTAEPNLRW